MPASVNAIGKDQGLERQPCSPGKVAVGSDVASFPACSSQPSPACCLSTASCRNAGWCLWLLLGTGATVRSQGACDFETWPFQLSLTGRSFHPGSLQWLRRIRRTPGRLGYRTALNAVLGNLKSHLSVLVHDILLYFPKWVFTVV